MNGRNGGLFTGRGFTTTGSSVRVGYQYFGLSDVGPTDPNDWTTINYTGMVNGTMAWSSSASVATYGTTAFNGFVDGTVGSTVMSGSVNGYIASSDTQPTPVWLTQSTHSKLWYVKILAGSLAVESRALLSTIDSAIDVNGIIGISFGFTLIGLPRQAQFAYLAGVAQP